MTYIVILTGRHIIKCPKTKVTGNDIFLITLQEGLSPREYLEFTEREREVVPPPPEEEPEGSGEPTYISEPGEPGPRGPPGVTIFLFYQMCSFLRKNFRTNLVSLVLLKMVIFLGSWSTRHGRTKR